MKRKQPTLIEQRDALLLQLNPELREWAKSQPAGAVAKLYECDHYPIAIALGGTNHPTNLVFRIHADHREKTAKTDIPVIAKSKRLTKAQEEFRANILAKTQETPPAVKRTGLALKSRPMAGTKASGWRKGVNKIAERR